VSRYIRVSQRTSEVRTFRLSSLRLRVLEYTERELVHGSLREFLSLTLSNWWFSHWLGRRSAIGRNGVVLFFCRFLRWIAVKDGGKHGAYVDPSLTRQSSSVLVNTQDQIGLISSQPISNFVQTYFKNTKFISHKNKFLDQNLSNFQEPNSWCQLLEL